MSTWRENRIRRINDIYDDEEKLLLLISTNKRVRSPSIYRHRCKLHLLFTDNSYKVGDSDYLINLASTENSFIKEYRLDPVSFDYLVSLLEPFLKVDHDMANLAMTRS